MASLGCAETRGLRGHRERFGFHREGHLGPHKDRKQRDDITRCPFPRVLDSWLDDQCWDPGQKRSYGEWGVKMTEGTGRPSRHWWLNVRRWEREGVIKKECQVSGFSGLGYWLGTSTIPQEGRLRRREREFCGSSVQCQTC